MRWGLILPWAREIGKSSLFNARAETAAEKASFRAAVKNKRCLVPMDGWYEWRKAVDDDGKAIKVPYFMSPADGAAVHGRVVVGMARERRRTDDPPLLSCTILTTDAVGPLQQVHDRMPLIMPVQWWEQWLDPDAPASPALRAARAGIGAGHRDPRGGAAGEPGGQQRATVVDPVS